MNGSIYHPIEESLVFWRVLVTCQQGWSSEGIDWKYAVAELNQVFHHRLDEFATDLKGLLVRHARFSCNFGRRRFPVILSQVLVLRSGFQIDHLRTDSCKTLNKVEPGVETIPEVCNSLTRDGANSMKALLDRDSDFYSRLLPLPAMSTLALGGVCALL